MSGQPLGYTNWAQGEPNNGAGTGDQDYGIMNFGPTNEWDDQYAFVDNLRGLIEIGGDNSPARNTEPAGFDDTYRSNCL